MTTTTTAALVRHGRHDWHHVRHLLAGADCLWADLDGLHLTTGRDLPSATPVATHLWGWQQDESFRIRFDRANALVASLRTGPTTGGAPYDGTAVDDLPTTLVTVRISDGLPWTEDRHEVGKLPQAVYNARFELLEIAGAAPVTFVRAALRP
ncbi:hypothetical protein ACFO6V_07140 [Promicromonospora alba]|uniref:Uncharacterized protein n=1 Tax=Promicromonospora alba TaxID=1616110 RepID=A0ABV9HFG1_9MICO